MKYKSDVTAIRAFPFWTNSLVVSPQYIFSGLRLLWAKHRSTQLEHFVPNQQRPLLTIADNATSQSLNPSGERQSCDSEYMISKAAPVNPFLSRAFDKLPRPDANSTKRNRPAAIDSWFAIALSQMFRILSSRRMVAMWGNASSRIVGHHTDAYPWWNCRSNDRKERILNAICWRRPRLLHLIRVTTVLTSQNQKRQSNYYNFNHWQQLRVLQRLETSLRNAENNAKLANNRCEIRWNILSFSILAVSMVNRIERCEDKLDSDDLAITGSAITGEGQGELMSPWCESSSCFFKIFFLTFLSIWTPMPFWVLPGMVQEAADIK